MIEYLEARIFAIELLLEIHVNNEYLIMERAICVLTLDKLKTIKS